MNKSFQLKWLDFFLGLRADVVLAVACWMWKAYGMYYRVFGQVFHSNCNFIEERGWRRRSMKRLKISLFRSSAPFLRIHSYHRSCWSAANNYPTKLINEKTEFEWIHLIFCCFGNRPPDNKYEIFSNEANETTALYSHKIIIGFGQSEWLLTSPPLSHSFSIPLHEARWHRIDCRKLCENTQIYPLISVYIS